MFYFLITITTALALSIVGAYFSIIGLATIFPGEKESVIIMASILEIAKVITVIWLHRNWKKSKLLLRSYLTFSVLVLMGITSLGIFGFLSKSHVEHQYLTEKERTFIEEFELRIKTEESLIKKYEGYIVNNENKTLNPIDRSNNQKNNIQENIKMLEDKFNKDIEFEKNKIQTIKEIEERLDQELSTIEVRKGGLFYNKQKEIENIKESQGQKRLENEAELNLIKNKIEEIKNNYNSEYNVLYKSIKTLSEVAIVKEENIERENEDYLKEIIKSESKIQELKREKLKFDEKIMLLETEIGPLKYVVGLITDTTGKNFENDQAVRLIIVVIMVVFDPLAVLLLIAAQISFKKDRGEFINSTYIDLHNKIKKMN